MRLDKKDKFIADKVFVTLNLANISRSKGGDYFYQNWFVDVEVLETKAHVLSKTVDVDVSVLKVDVPDNETKVKLGKADAIINCEGKFCIKKGDKSELIREINIRLAGFGGNVPTDEFTDRTEKMVKQFQKDYMKVPETGKVCGNVLKAIDDFQIKHVIDINQAKCPCGKCTGFDNGKNADEKGNSKILEMYRKYEYPGMHRTILWTQRAIQFYLANQEKDRKLTVGVLFSGYRCTINNQQKGRKSTNHMGKASDLHIYGGTGDREKNANAVRDVLVKYSGAKYRWNDKNVIALEADNRNGTASDFKASTWVHYDVRTFELKYLEDKYFAKTMADCNGKNMIILATELGFQRTCLCNPAKAAAVDPTATKPATTCEDKFKKVAPIILKHEGGYVNDPDDSGGETNKGITIGTFKSYAKEDLGIEPTSENLKKLTDEQATTIYRKRYWEPKGFCKILDDKVSLMIYDWTITSGGAVKQVQKLLKSDFAQNISDDGGMGSKTIDAINNVEDQAKLLKRIGEIRKEYYTNLAIKDGVHTKNYKFLAGWHSRVDDCL